MTARHRVYFDPETLFAEAHARQLPIEFDNAHDVAVIVIEPGLEWAAHLPVAGVVS